MTSYKELYWKKPEQYRAKSRRSYYKQRERWKEQYRERYRVNREKALEVYGSKCKCCGETEKRFLVLDHINGISEKAPRTKNTYSWVKKHNYPKEFQVLCHNCNFAKTLGICPHKTL